MPLPMRYFHGSFDPLPVELHLAGRGEAYAQAWDGTDFYPVLERYRPPSSLAHHAAVFMVDDPDLIDAAGGATEWCAEVVPAGRVERHDLAWCTRISELLGDGHAVEAAAVRTAAEAYWLGAPFPDPDRSLWEYLTPSAQVLRCEPFETFERDPSPPRRSLRS